MTPILFETENIDIAADIFTSVMMGVLDKHVPIVTIQNRKNYVPYISNEIRTAMKIRDDLKVQAASSGKPEDFDKYKINGMTFLQN